MRLSNAMHPAPARPSCQGAAACASPLHAGGSRRQKPPRHSRTQHRGCGGGGGGGRCARSRGTEGAEQARTRNGCGVFACTRGGGGSGEGVAWSAAPRGSPRARCGPRCRPPARRVPQSPEWLPVPGPLHLDPLPRLPRHRKVLRRQTPLSTPARPCRPRAAIEADAAAGSVVAAAASAAAERCAAAAERMGRRVARAEAVRRVIRWAAPQLTRRAAKSPPPSSPRPAGPAPAQPARPGRRYGGGGGGGGGGGAAPSGGAGGVGAHGGGGGRLGGTWRWPRRSF